MRLLVSALAIAGTVGCAKPYRATGSEFQVATPAPDGCSWVTRTNYVVNVDVNGHQSRNGQTYLYLCCPNPAGIDGGPPECRNPKWEPGSNKETLQPLP
jgi:hypothetical protein